MTEPERAALDHIRQVVDSVIGAPAPAEPLVPGTSMNVLPVPFVSALGDAAAGSVSDSGAAAGVMLVRAYTGEAVTIGDFHRQTGQGTANALSFTQIMTALGANGVPVELRSNLKLADLSLILFSGRPVIAPIQQAVLHQAGLAKEVIVGPYYVIVVGADVKQVYVHDPFQQDTSGNALGIGWLTFYQAWSQAQGYVRAVLVPRQQLIRRVRVTASLLDVYEQPGGADANPAGTVSLGDVFEVLAQKNGWGKIDGDRWINLSYTADI